MRSHLVYTLHFLLFPIRLPLHSSLLLLWHNLNYEFIYIYINFVDCTVHSVCAVCVREASLHFAAFFPHFRRECVCIYFIFSSSTLCAKLQPPRVLNNWARCQWAANSSSELQTGGSRTGGGEWGDNNASCCNNAEAKTVARRGVNFTNTNTTTSLPHFLLPPFLPLYTSLPYTHLPLYCHSLPALHIILCLLNL